MKRMRHTWLSAFLPLLSLGMVSWVGPPTAEVRWTARDLEFVRTTVQVHYPYWRMKGIQAAEPTTGVQRADRSRASTESENRSGDASYRREVVRFLKNLRDGHVYVEVRGRKTYPYIPGRRRDRGAFDPRQIPHHLGGTLKPVGEGNVFYARTPENLGYLLIRSFSDAGVGRDVGEGLRLLRHTRGLILDVRNNGGGNAAGSNPVISWFLTEPLEKPPVFHRGERLRFLPLLPEVPAYLSPVVVLINGVCFSETERFVEMMRRLPQVTLVGDTTGGGSAGGEDRFLLPNGSVVSFGTYDYRRYDGTPWEGEGISPDILVPQTSAHSAAGVDVQLETALSLLSSSS